MIDVKKDLVAALKSATSWTVYYELLYKPGTIPAITYKELENNDLLNGDSVDYSTIRYEIKVWSYSMDEVIAKSIAIDSALKALGWSRYSSFEASYETQILKVLRYVAVGYDEVN